MTRKPRGTFPYGIIVGIAAGGVFGAAWPGAAVQLKFVGDLFLNALMMLVVPLIFVSMVYGITRFGDVRRMGKPLALVLFYYLSTTFIAVGIGILLVNLIQPGAGAQAIAARIPDNLKATMAEPMGVTEFLEDFVVRLVPRNIMGAMAEMQVLPLILFSLFFGGVLTTMSATGARVIEFFESLYEAILIMVQIVIRAAPVGVGCLVAARLGETGGGAAFYDIIIRLFKYMFTVIIGLILHGLIVLPLILLIFSRRSPLRFISAMLPALATGFSTASSSATLPLSMECVNNSGVAPRTTGLVLPLGATVNMDGTALYEAVAVIFIGQLYGIHLEPVQMIIIFFTATLAAIGAAGIPEAGLVTMIMVLNAVGYPAEVISGGMATILTIDWFLDRCRTTVNIWGDMVGAAVVDRYAAPGPTPDTR